MIHARSLCSTRDARRKQANAQASFPEVVRLTLLCRSLLETQCCCSSLATGALPVQQLPIYTRHTLDTFSRSLSTHPPEQTVRVIMLKPGNILRVLCLPQATLFVLATSSPKSLGNVCRESGIRGSRRCAQRSKTYMATWLICHWWFKAAAHWIRSDKDDTQTGDIVSRVPRVQEDRKLRRGEPESTVRTCLVHPSTILLFYHRKTGRSHTPCGSILASTTFPASSMH